MKINSKATQNLFVLPFIISFVQFCFLFVALFKSQYFFEIKILSTAGIYTFLGFGLCIFSFMKNKDIYFSVKNIGLFILFILIGFYIVRFSWFDYYLSLDAIDNFFNTGSHIDTLYHSSIAESIVTNGYPSIQQNAPIFLKYHTLSHYLVCIISISLKLPAYITYNYLFPTLFMPFFTFLLLKTVLVFRAYLKKDLYFSFIDYVFIAGIITGFMFFNFQQNTAFWIYQTYLSESYLISLIGLFLFFCFAYFINRYAKHSEMIILAVLIPLFLPILLFAKLSTGFMFLLGCCYYVFRKYFPLNFKMFFILLYMGIFLLYYNIPAPLATLPDPEQIKHSFFFLLHFITTYAKGPYKILHYVIMLAPSIILFKYCNKIKLFSKSFFTSKENLFIEMAVLLSLGSCLPGLVVKIDGGSAFYFCMPVFTTVLVFLLGTDIPNQFFTRSFSFTPFYISSCRAKPYKLPFYVLLFVYIFIILCQDSRCYSCLYDTISCRTDMVNFKNRLPYSFFTIFSRKRDPDNDLFVSFNEINAKTKNNKKDFCIFVDNDFKLIDIYDKESSYYSDSPPVSHMKAYLATTAYLGMPIINSMYVANNLFFRGDGLYLGGYSDIVGYSMPPIICDKVTKENMHDIAKKLNKKYIILLTGTSYKIIDVI